jgi:hypothetical protein
MATMDRRQQHQRYKELCLVVFGYALNKGPARQEVLSAIGPGMLEDPEVDNLLNCLRPNGSGTGSASARCIRQWFSERGAPLADGRTPLEAALSGLQVRATLSQMDRLATEMKLSKLESAPDVVRRLRGLADQLEASL